MSFVPRFTYDHLLVRHLGVIEGARAVIEVFKPYPAYHPYNHNQILEILENLSFRIDTQEKSQLVKPMTFVLWC
ncbi:hypothetical protein [Scytonema sp. NUACC26]|uniref:hypothetical protein n=1 Tax=Scytonema sp. NUACC26 TaxID=3140176 RepID=UPI0034DBDD32